MTGDPVRIIPHSPVGIPDTGSFEVRTPKLDQRRGYLPRDADPACSHRRVQHRRGMARNVTLEIAAELKRRWAEGKDNPTSLQHLLEMARPTSPLRFVGELPTAALLPRRHSTVDGRLG